MFSLLGMQYTTLAKKLETDFGIFQIAQSLKFWQTLFRVCSSEFQALSSDVSDPQFTSYDWQRWKAVSQQKFET